MKKLVLTLAILFLSSGCAQLKKGQMQPVVSGGEKDTYVTTCSGAVETWHTCNLKANETCKKSYEVLDKQESIINGWRELRFKCVVKQ